jgi:hypothetical protein
VELAFPATEEEEEEEEEFVVACEPEDALPE